MVAGWEDAGVSVVTRWEFPGVPAFDGRRRGEEADDAFDRRGPVSVGAGWEDDCVSVVTRWEFPGVPAFDGRRRGEEADDAFDRRGPVSVGAGWEDDCVYFGGVSGLQG